MLKTLRAALITAPLIAIATAVMGSLNLLVALWDDKGDAQLGVARAWGRMLLSIAGVRARVEGLEKIDPHRSYVVVANHVSYMDTPLILTHLPVNFRFMAKKELFQIPFIGSHLGKAGHIAVPRDDPRAAVKVMSSAGRMMKERGISVLVFPEGGRSATGELQTFKDGAAYLAVKGGVPVLPVAHQGMHAILPMHSWLVRPGDVVVRIGDVIEVESGKIDRAALTEQLRSTIAELQRSEPVYTA